MSGSGGGGYIPPERVKFNCKTGQINTVLSSIDLAVLKKLVVGIKLEVEIGKNDSLIVLNSDGELVGSVIHPNTADIIECIKNGSEYAAEIIELNFPACKITIKHIVV